MHEVLTRLLAVADDVDAGIFLQLEREERCIELGGRRARRRRDATAPTVCSARRASPASAGCRRSSWGTCDCHFHLNVTRKRHFTRPNRSGGSQAVRPPRCAPRREVTHGERRARSGERRRPFVRAARCARAVRACGAFHSVAYASADMASWVQTFGEHDRILDCHRGPLGEEREHRMGGIAEQRNRPGSPRPQGGRSCSAHFTHCSGVASNVRAGSAQKRGEKRARSSSREPASLHPGFDQVSLTMATMLTSVPALTG